MKFLMGNHTTLYGTNGSMCKELVAHARVPEFRSLEPI